MVTLEEIGIDKIIVDEAQGSPQAQLRHQPVNLKGVDPDGSQRALGSVREGALILDRQRQGAR